MAHFALAEKMARRLEPSRLSSSISAVVSSFAAILRRRRRAMAFTFDIFTPVYKVMTMRGDAARAIDERAIKIGRPNYSVPSGLAFRIDVSPPRFSRRH